MVNGYCGMVIGDIRPGSLRHVWISAVAGCFIRVETSHPWLKSGLETSDSVDVIELLEGLVRIDSANRSSAGPGRGRTDRLTLGGKRIHHRYFLEGQLRGAGSPWSGNSCIAAATARRSRTCWGEGRRARSIPVLRPHGHGHEPAVAVRRRGP